MNWQKEYIYIPQYEYTSSNQYGDRFKRKKSKKLSVANISCKRDNVVELQYLILLSHTLSVPVRYDFEDHTAYIRIVSHEALQKGI